MWIVQLALRRTYTFIVMALLIVVLGVVSMRRMPADIFPDIDIPVVTVVWTYAGMPAEEIERRLILNCERNLTAAVNDIEHIESQAFNGIGVIRIYFQPHSKIETAVSLVTAVCQTVLRNAPPGTNPPYIVRYSATSVPIVQIAISSETLTEQQLYDYASNFIIQRLGTVQGARVPQPYGGKPKQVMVDINPDALYARGLSPADVSRAVNAQNLILPAGSAKIGDVEYNIRLNSSPDVVEAFNNMPVKTVNGATVYVRDVAQVRDGFAVQTNVVRRDGRRAVLLPVLKSEGASTLDVVERVRKAMPLVQAQLPPEVKLDLLFDQSVFVKAAVEGVIHEAAIAAGLTALMILLFLGSWRSTLIVIVSIPLAIFCSMVALWGMGLSVNTMTLGGLALAVGILVDDATVEIENIHRNLGMHKPLRRAILDGAQEIAVPAFVATLAICIVFVPVLFLTGPVAYLFAPLALAVVFAMMASYFLSRTVVPTMALFLLKKEADEHQHGAPPPKTFIGRFLRGFHRGFERGFEGFRSAYLRVLAWALSHRAATVVGMLAFAAGSLAFFPWLGRDFFPAVDGGQFRLHVRAPAGTRLEETERVFGRVENAIREIVPDAERESILDNFGVPQFYTNVAFIDNDTVSASDGEILVSLKHGHRPTAEFVEKLRVELPHRFPECTFYFMPADITGQILTFGKSAPLNVQVVGLNREANLALAKKLKTRFGEVPGLVDVRIRQITDTPDIRVDIDRVMASDLNLTQNDVAQSVLVSLSSNVQTAPNFWVNPKNGVNYRVSVQTPQGQVDSVDALLQTPIFAPGADRPQLLANLADLTRASSVASVNHYNVQAVYEVCASVQGTDLGSVADQVRRIVAEVQSELPRGSTIAMRGQVESMDEAFYGLATGLGFAVLLVYLLIVVNFQSWLDPFIILTALPGALAGVAWGLFATDTTVSVPALMGVIMCVGVSTANSILMVTFANEKRRDGGSAIESAYAAGGVRLRPVLMTALAMIVGMVPMSLGLGEGGEQNAPLARAVIGGLSVATAYTLIFVPVMYSLLRRQAPPPELDDDGEPIEPATTHDAQRYTASPTLTSHVPSAAPATRAIPFGDQTAVSYD